MLKSFIISQEIYFKIDLGPQVSRKRIQIFSMTILYYYSALQVLKAHFNCTLFIIVSFNLKYLKVVYVNFSNRTTLER